MKILNMNLCIKIFQFIPFILILCNLNLIANDKKQLIREGNKLFKEQKFNDAEIKYRKAQEIEYGFKSTFNLADALYKQGNYEEAAQKFSELTAQKLDKQTMASINHNLGNSFFQNGKYEESVKAYKNALKLNPKDNDTRYNLELAKHFLKQQQEQQQQQQQNQENNENKNNQDNQESNQNEQNQNSPEQNQQADNKQEQNQKNNNQQQNGSGNQGKEKEIENQQESNKPRPYQISKEDAERMLNAIQKDERELQKKLKKQKSERAKIERNW
jgi:tetratricopeptide (TPR) repeat protein